MNTKTDKCPICRHIKTDGRRCQSPAITGSVFCYYHRFFLRSHQAVTAPKPAALRPETVKYFLENGLDPAQFASSVAPARHFAFPPLEDVESVQISISLLFAAIAADQIDPVHARNLLYALQLASYNVRGLPVNSDADPSTLARHVVRSRHGHPLAASGEGNGVPSEPDRPNSCLDQFFEQNSHPKEIPEDPTTPTV